MVSVTFSEQCFSYFWNTVAERAELTLWSCLPTGLGSSDGWTRLGIKGGFSQNSRVIWVGKDLQDPRVPVPNAQLITSPEHIRCQGWHHFGACWCPLTSRWMEWADSFFSRWMEWNNSFFPADARGGFFTWRSWIHVSASFSAGAWLRASHLGHLFASYFIFFPSSLSFLLQKRLFKWIFSFIHLNKKPNRLTLLNAYLLNRAC